WIALPDRLVAVDVVEHARLEHEEAAVDPPLADLRLLGELGDELAVELQAAEAGGRTHSRHGRKLSLRAMEREQVPAVDVGQTVAVGEHERAVADVRGEALDAAARLRLRARVDQMDAPVVPMAVVHLDLAI